MSGVSASPVLWKSYNQIPWGFPVPLSDPQTVKPDVGFRTFTTVGKLLWYYCSPVCGSLTQCIWALILSWLYPSYHLPAAFFGRFQHPPVDGCSADSCNFGALSGGDERTSFCPTVLNWKPACSYSSILMDLRSIVWLTLLPFPPHSWLIYCIFLIFFSLWCIIDHFFWPIFQYTAFFYSYQLADKVIYCNFHFTYSFFMSRISMILFQLYYFAFCSLFSII